VDIKKIIQNNINVRPDVFSKKYPEVVAEIYKLTSPYLTLTNNLREHYDWVLNNRTNFPKCKCCNSNVSWNPSCKKYRQYCSTKCMSNDKDIINKKKQTCIKHYGGIAPAANINIQQKMKATLEKNYGKEKLKNPIILQKKINTCIDR